MSDESGGIPSIVPFLKRDGTKPYLAGARCAACGHVFVGERAACAKCTTRDRMEPVRLAETGKLYVYTVVRRSFPGVAVPFVDAIVDLDDGSHLKGTLEGVEPDPDRIPFNMRIKVAYRDAQPVNGGGKAYLTYYFLPA